MCYALGARIDLGPEAELGVVMLSCGFSAGILFLLVKGC